MIKLNVKPEGKHCNKILEVKLNFRNANKIQESTTKSQNQKLEQWDGITKITIKILEKKIIKNP